jgi:hypothetical protein
MDEVFISNRQTNARIKLSLHQADAYGRAAASRLAFTTEFSEKEGFADREIFRGPEAPEFAPGWRQAAVILTPSITFGNFTERRLRSREGPIQWFPAPPPPDHLKFYVMVAEAGFVDLNVTDHIGEVGHMELANGRFVGVVADSRPATEADKKWIRADLKKAAETHGAYPFTWQRLHDVTVFLDLAALLTP